MEFSGFVKSSLIDYPGKISAVLFTQGCNFACGFCHNPDLVPLKAENLRQYSEKEVLEFLASRKGKLEGVVITGGEPLIHREIEGFIREVKDMGYLVKLDTNGTNPEFLRKLIKKGLVDLVAMDIKNRPEKYSETTSTKVHNKTIAKSIKIIMSSNLPYEFRTTVLPHFHEISDFEEIGKMIKGAKCYAVQGFVPKNTLNKDLEEAEPFNAYDLQKIAVIMQKYVENVVVRGNL